MTDIPRRQLLSGAAATAVTAALPGSMFSASANANLLKPSTEARAFYQNTMVIDALSFAQEWNQDAFKAAKRSGYAGIVTSLPRRDLQVAIDALIQWRERIASHSDKLLLALSANDFVRAKQSGRLAVLMNFQNATMIEDKVENVDALHALGMRCFQLTYNSRNLLGDGCTERTNAGLSDFGIEVVKRMNEKGVLVDLSHCGKQTTLDGIAFSDKPVAITHSMVDKFRPGHPRAKTDDQLRKLADKGGVFGVTAIGYFVGPDPGGKTTIETYADHIDHAVKVIGYDHVAISTDFPINGISPWATRENWYEPRLKSFKPSYDVKWPPWIPGLDEPERYLNLTAVLRRRGWSWGNLEKLLGQNWLRLFRDAKIQ